jgi:hypothetical protein
MEGPFLKIYTHAPSPACVQRIARYYKGLPRITGVPRVQGVPRVPLIQRVPKKFGKNFLRQGFLGDLGRGG